MVAEGLNILLERAKEQGMIRGASVGHQDFIISHLQFADDTIIFCEANWDEIRVLKRILRCFEVMSGLKINFHKSIVCGIGVGEELVKEFANNLNCLSQSLPFSYLGLPLGANPRKKSTWKPVVEKFKKKLASWKRRFLSFAGRLTLIKSGLSNLPVYFLSIFKLPIGVAKTIDRIQSNFLWGGSEVQRKIHLVQWKEVCKSKDQGGLGVRSLSDVNICLMVKWWWRYGHQQQSLWKMVVCSRYGGNGGRWKPETVSTAMVSTVWKDIVSVISANSVAAEFFSQNFRIIVGNGERIHFWTDRWFNDMSLRSEFPRLFSLSVEKEGSLQFFYHRKGPGSDWKLAFRRSLLAWEEEEVHRLNVLLAEVPNLNPITEDHCLWRASNSGVFSVASMWKRLELANGPTVPITKFLWKNAAPPKAQFFTWLAWKGRLKTAEFMQRIGAIPANVSPLCVFCKAEVETINHVLLLCPLVWKLWSALVNWWEVQWATPGSVAILLDWWSGMKFRKKEFNIWKVVPLAMLWSLWKLRNECLFNNGSADFAQVVELLKVRIALWIKSYVKGVNYNVHDIVANLKQVRGCIS
ncbi:unnamed protein product [Camellia sinensis]